MKNILKEYIELSEEQKESIWNNCDFVFDTNVLLNLYRYSAKTTKLLITSMYDLKERIWIPYNIAEEFLKNRLNIIWNKNDNINSLDKISSKFIKECCDILRLKNDDKEIQQLSESISSWIGQIRKEYTFESSKDDVLKKLLDLFDGKVGIPYSEEELIEIKKTAEQRYKKEIPPGYKDTNKQKDNCDNNMYGDYIIWRQILDYAKSHSRDIIFITQDKKEDWWYRISGRTIGPRVELRKEFVDTTNMQFNMYTLDNFLQLHKNVGRGLILEIRSMEWEDKYDVHVGHFFDLNDDYIAWQVEDGLKELMKLKERLYQYDISQLNEQEYIEIKELNSKINDLKNYLEMWGIWFKE